MKSLKENLSLILILALSLWLNITGLLPNTLFSQHEPGFIAPADQIIKNFILEGNIDPDVQPHPFKYATTAFYSQSIIRGGAIFFFYEIYKLAGLNYGIDEKYFEVDNFGEFALGNGGFLLGERLLWISRMYGVLFGVGCVLLTYLISLKLFKNELTISVSKNIALLASLSLAVMPLHVRYSHYAIVDISQVFFFLLAFLASLSILQGSRYKSYAWAGFLVGFSASLKYFPLSLVPFLIIHLLKVRWKVISRPFLLSLLTMFLGYFAGMPYLFIHFDKILELIPQALAWYSPDQLTQDRSLISRLLPSYFHFYHLKFLAADGVLILPLAASIIGIITGLRKYRHQTFLLLIIPLLNGIFITFYLKQIYEQLTLPALPFLAIFIALFVYQSLTFVNRIKAKKLKFLVALVIPAIVFIPSLFNSAKASIDCGKQITDFQARDWIVKNIPESTVVAYHPGTRHPSMEMEWVESVVRGNFSLSELQEQKTRYLILIDGYYGTYLEWSYDLLVPEKHILENQYAKLAVDEIKKEAILVAEFRKHTMCVGNKIEIYGLPEALQPAKKHLRTYSFNSVNDRQQFSLLRKDEEVEIRDEGTTIYFYEKGRFDSIRADYNFFYSPPYSSGFINAEGNKKYTALLRFKGFTADETVKRDGYIRINFFDKNKKILKTSLSPKGKITDRSEEIVVTSISPPQTHLLTIGFQSLVLSNQGSFLLNNVDLFGE